MNEMSKWCVHQGSLKSHDKTQMSHILCCCISKEAKRKNINIGPSLLDVILNIGKHLIGRDKDLVDRNHRAQNLVRDIEVFNHFILLSISGDNCFFTKSFAGWYERKCSLLWQYSFWVRSRKSTNLSNSSIIYISAFRMKAVVWSWNAAVFILGTRLWIQNTSYRQ